MGDGSRRVCTCSSYYIIWILPFDIKIVKNKYYFGGSRVHATASSFKLQVVFPALPVAETTNELATPKLSPVKLYILAATLTRLYSFDSTFVGFLRVKEVNSQDGSACVDVGVGCGSVAGRYEPFTRTTLSPGHLSFSFSAS